MNPIQCWRLLDRRGPRILLLRNGQRCRVWGLRQRRRRPSRISRLGWQGPPHLITFRWVFLMCLKPFLGSRAYVWVRLNYCTTEPKIWNQDCFTNWIFVSNFRCIISRKRCVTSRLCTLLLYYCNAVIYCLLQKETAVSRFSPVYLSYVESEYLIIS